MVYMLSQILFYKTQDVGKKCSLFRIVIFIQLVEIIFQKITIDSTATLWYLLIKNLLYLESHCFTGMGYKGRVRNGPVFFVILPRKSGHLI